MYILMEIVLIYTVRQATIEDCGLIHSLAWEVFPQTYRHILSPEQTAYLMHWMYDVDSLRRQMEHEGHVYFLAYAGSEPVGYVSIRRETEEVVHLEKIYVLPRYQGAHAGGFLFRHAVAKARELFPDAQAMELNVNRSNPALDFYRHMGMRIDREGDFDIGNGFYMNDYIMRLEL